MIYKNLVSFLIVFLLGLIFYISFRSSSIDSKYKTKKEKLEAIALAAKHLFINKKENRKNISLYEYWKEKSKNTIKYERHGNSFQKLKSYKEDVNMIELDIKTTMQGLRVSYVILDNPLSKLPDMKHPKVFPKLDKWLDRFFIKYKNKKKPALKLNIFARAYSIFQILKKYKIDQMGIPLWIGTRGFFFFFFFFFLKKFLFLKIRFSFKKVFLEIQIITVFLIQFIIIPMNSMKSQHLFIVGKKKIKK